MIIEGTVKCFSKTQWSSGHRSEHCLPTAFSITYPGRNDKPGGQPIMRRTHHRGCFRKMLSLIIMSIHLENCTGRKFRWFLTKVQLLSLRSWVIKLIVVQSTARKSEPRLCRDWATHTFKINTLWLSGQSGSFSDTEDIHARRMKWSYEFISRRIIPLQTLWVKEKYLQFISEQDKVRQHDSLAMSTSWSSRVT